MKNNIKYTSFLYIILVYGILFSFIATAYALTCKSITISGVVTDSETCKPVEGVIISTKSFGFSYRSITDINGKYNVRVDVPVNYFFVRLVTEKNGYLPSIKALRDKGGDTVNFSLRQQKYKFSKREVKKTIDSLMDDLGYKSLGWGPTDEERAKSAKANKAILEMGSEAVPFLIKRLEDTRRGYWCNYSVSLDITYILEEIGDERAIPVFLSTAKEGWIPSIIVLGELQVDAAVPILLDALEQDKIKINNYDANRREYAARALGLIGDKRAVDGLIRRVENDNDLHVAWEAMLALCNIEDERAVPCLEKKIQDERYSKWDEEEISYIKSHIRAMKRKANKNGSDGNP